MADKVSIFDPDNWDLGDSTSETPEPAKSKPSIVDTYKQLAEAFPGTVISSLQRSPKHNAEVGGVPNSQHISGTAGDFVVPADMRDSFKATARAKGLEAIDEGDHVHLELPPGKTADAVLPSGKPLSVKGNTKDIFDASNWEDVPAAKPKVTKTAAPVLPQPAAPAEPTFSEVLGGMADRIKANFNRTFDSFSNGAMAPDAANRELQYAEADVVDPENAQMRRSLRNVGSIFPMPQRNVEQAKAEKIKAVAAEVKLENERAKAIEASYKSPSKIAYDKALAQAGTSESPFKSSVVAMLQNPLQATGALAEATVPMLPALVTSIPAPEVGIPVLALQAGVDTYATGFSDYLTRQGVDTTNQAEVEAYLAANPTAVEDAAVSRDLHTMASAGSMLAAPGASKAVLPFVRSGSAAAVATKALASEAVMQPAIQAGAVAAADVASGEKVDQTAAAQNLLGGLPLAVVGAKSGYSGVMKERAVNTKAGIDSILVNDANVKGKIEQTKASEDARTADILQSEITKDNARAEQDAAEAAAKQQKADEEEAAFQTIERQRTANKLATKFKVAEPEPVTVEEVRAQRKSKAPVEDTVTKPVDVEQPAADAGVQPVVEAGEPAKVEAKPELKPIPKEPTDTSDGDLSSAGIENLKSRLGLDMADTSKPGTPEAAKAKADNDDFKAKATAIIKGLVSRGTKQTDAVQTALRNRKIQIHKNAESIGRDDIGVANFDEDGTIRIYTDKLDPKEPGGIVGHLLQAAPHESLHGLQESPRSGREALLAAIAKPDSGTDVAKLVIKLAGEGNVIAKRALDKANAAKEAAASKGMNPDKVFAHELMAYTVGELARARESQTTLGRMGGVLRDIESGARSVLRKAGVDLNPTIHDIEYATRNVVDELNKTDVKGLPEGSLDMLGYNKAGLQAAKDNGEPTIITADGREAYWIDDRDASLKEDVWNSMKVGDTKQLHEVYNHPKLFEQYPELRHLIVEKIPGSSGGFQSKNGKILIGEHQEGKAKGAFSTITHEVVHGVQEWEKTSPGGSAKEFANAPKLLAEVSDARAKLQAEVAKLASDGKLFSKYLQLNGWTQDNARTKASTGHSPDEQLAELESIEYVNKNANSPDSRIKAVVAAKLKTLLNGLVISEFRYPELKDAIYNLRDVEGSAYRDYRRLYGERQAFATEELLWTKDAEGNQVRNTEPVDINKFAKDTADNAIVKPDSLGLPIKVKDDLRRQAREFSEEPKRKATLDMADEANTPKEKKGLIAEASKYVSPTIKALFSSAKGAGDVPRSIMEHAIASPSGALMEAEASAAKYRESLPRLAAARGMTAEQLNKEIIDRIEAIDIKNDDYNTNKAAFVKAVSPYGEAGEALINLRNQADSLSYEMLAARAKTVDENPLTEAEKKVYQTIKNNLGRYVHRQFAVHAKGGVGEKYSRTILKDFETYKKKNGENVSPAVVKNYNTVADGIRRLVDEELVIPEDADLAELSAERVRMLFDTWGGSVNPEAFTLADMVDTLSKKRDAVNGDEDRVGNMAESIVRDILNPNDPSTPIGQYYRGAKLDKGILQKREHLPKEIKALMGELKDPEVALLNTVAKQLEFVARSNMFLELKDNVGSDHLLPPDAAGSKGATAKGWSRLEGDLYGALQNHFVSPELRNMLSDHVQMLATFDQVAAMASTRPDVVGQFAAAGFGKGWGKVVGFYKKQNIVRDLPNYIYNLGFGWTTMIKNGNLNPATFGEALKTASQIINHAHNPSGDALLARRAASAGVTDSAFAGELQYEKQAAIVEAVTRMIKDKPNATMATIMKGLKKANLLSTEAYAMMDVVWKLADFYHQADYILPKFYEAQGIKKTRTELDREAADITNRTHVTFKRTAPIVKGLERVGLSYIGPYTYEVFRSELNNIGQGLDEIQRASETDNPEAAFIMRSQGIRRLSGQIASWGIMYGIAKMASQFTFGDDKEKEKKLRSLLVEQAQNKDLVTMGTDENGTPIMMDVSRFDPAGPMNDFARTALNRNATPAMFAKQMADLYIVPSLVGQIYTAATKSANLDKSKVQTSMLQENLPSAYEGLLEGAKAVGIERRTTQAWTNPLEKFGFGFMSEWKDSSPRPVVRDFTSGVATATSYAGSRLYKLDPQAALSRVGYDYKDAAKLGKDEVSALFNDDPNMTEVDLLGELKHIQNKEKIAFDKAKEVYQGAIAYGMTPRAISVELKKIVPAEVITDLHKGTYRSHVVSKKSLEQYMMKELDKAKTIKQKAEVKTKWKDVMRRLDIANQQLEELNEDAQ